MAEASMRSMPMEVLALGLPRTGTASMQAALQTLGYREVYHGFHMLDFPEDTIFWEKQVDAKFYGNGTGCRREDFDELLGKFAAITDMPCACFAPELLAAYPEAKVILVQRDFDAWYKSFDENVISTLFSRLADLIVNWIEPMLGGNSGRMNRKVILGYFQATTPEEVRKNARSIYMQHYEGMRNSVPTDKLLNFDLSSGWKPLCEFLGRDVPDVDFPRIKESAALKAKIWEVEKQRLRDGGRKLAGWIAPPLAAGLAMYWYWSSPR